MSHRRQLSLHLERRARQHHLLQHDVVRRRLGELPDAHQREVLLHRLPRLEQQQRARPVAHRRVERAVEEPRGRQVLDVLALIALEPHVREERVDQEVPEPHVRH